MPELLVPPYPYRSPQWAPAWTALFGRRARNSVYGWSDDAFRSPWKTRKVFGFTVHIVSDADAIGRVLLENKINYERPALVRKLLRPGLGSGLFNAEGDIWRDQRRIVAPTFSPAAVAGLTDAIAETARARIALWHSEAAPRDMAVEATATTMAIIAATLFGGDARLTMPAAAGHIAAMLDATGRARLTTMLGLRPMGRGSGLARTGRRFLRETLGTMVDESVARGGGRDFFSGLVAALHARYPKAEARELAIDNAVTFYVAGHETTANALAWTIYLAAAQPDLQEQLRTEAQAALSGGDLADLDSRLPKLRAVLDEALRLYPPAPRIDREAMADDELAGRLIRRGDLVSIWPYILHRHHALWPNPDAFDPDRFMPDRRTSINRFQYLPFGAGPRVCVGARFAIVEALIVLAHWLAARRFALLPGPPPVPVGRVTLRPAQGMPLMVSSL